MQPLRLGIVCYPTVGGSGVVATEMAVAAAERGHEVHLLSYARPTRLPESTPVRLHDVHVAGYPLLRYPPYALALAARMLEVHEQCGVDLFHVHYAIPHAVSAFLAREMSEGELRFVTTLHGTDITVVGADPAYARPTRFAIEASDAVTAVSRFLASETAEVFGVERSIDVVPNFVDPNRYRPGAARPFYDRPQAERILVHASNFRPVKRVADVIRAFDVVRKELPARLLLIGDGPDRDHALAVAADLGCSPHVEHLGPRADLADLLPQADLCVMASETESFGLVLLEAMACGVPCAATDVGGVREVVGETGVLVPFGDPHALGRAAAELLADPARHRTLARAARERARTHFARDDVVDRYLELYSRVLAA